MEHYPMSNANRLYYRRDLKKLLTTKQLILEALKESFSENFGKFIKRSMTT